MHWHSKSITCTHFPPLGLRQIHTMSYTQAFLDGRGEDHDDCHSFSELVHPPLFCLTDAYLAKQLLQRSMRKVL